MQYERQVIANPPYENPSKRTTVFLSEHLVNMMETFALGVGTSKSALVQAALDRYFRQEPNGLSVLGSEDNRVPLMAPHDVFICHSSKDKIFARRLATDLESQGYRVWFDEFEMLAGDSLYEKIEHGIKHSVWFVVVLSPNSVESKWCRRELHNALEEEFERDKVYVVPILYKPCNVPGFLKEKVWVNFQGRKYKNGLHRLLKRLSK